MFIFLIIICRLKFIQNFKKFYLIVILILQKNKYHQDMSCRNNPFKCLPFHNFLIKFHIFIFSLEDFLSKIHIYS